MGEQGKWPATVRETRRPRYDPSPTQLELFEPAPVDFASAPLKIFGEVNAHRRSDCSVPARHTSDQYRCNSCGLVWDVDEERPPCDVTPYP